MIDCKHWQTDRFYGCYVCANKQLPLLRYGESQCPLSECLNYQVDVENSVDEEEIVKARRDERQSVFKEVRSMVDAYAQIFIHNLISKLDDMEEESNDS